MACAIGCWVRDTIFTENKRDLEYKKSMLNSIKSSKNVLNTTVPGMKGYDKNNSTFRDRMKQKEAQELADEDMENRISQLGVNSL